MNAPREALVDWSSHISWEFTLLINAGAGIKVSKKVLQEK